MKQASYTLILTLLVTMLGPTLSQAQSVGGGGATGGGVRSFNIKSGCEDGQIMYAHVKSDDSSEPRIRVCHNGSYMTEAEKKNYIYNPNSCRGEGATKTKYFRDVQTNQKYKATVQCIKSQWERISDYIPLKN